MNIFGTLEIYGQKWNITNTRQFSADEKAMVKSNMVVNSEYGLSVCFFMKLGGQAYIPLSRDSRLTAGDMIDLETAKILTLSREGEKDISRIEE